MYFYLMTYYGILPLGTCHSWQITTLVRHNTCKRGRNEYRKTIKAEEFSAAAGRHRPNVRDHHYGTRWWSNRRGLNNRSQWGCHCLLFWCVHCDEAGNVPRSLTYRRLLIYSRAALVPCHLAHMTRCGKRRSGIRESCHAERRFDRS